MIRDMHRFLVLAVFACGSGRSADSTLVIDDPKPVVPPDAAPAKPATTSKEPALTGMLSIEAACARFATLQGQGCEWTKRFPAGFGESANCENSLMTWMKDPKMQKSVGCWALE